MLLKTASMGVMGDIIFFLFAFFGSKPVLRGLTFCGHAVFYNVCRRENYRNFSRTY